ncbi:MAG: hypothetical protein NZM31_13615 [Gemmatales bacterium]|nr:hypothetical protein [Gemmatales bacterium]MDW8388034.1 hypothetical protein [Gemmatales bacterium]
MSTPHAAIVMDLHLQRDLPQAINFLHHIEETGYPLRSMSYEGDLVLVEANTMPNQLQKYWALWLI